MNTLKWHALPNNTQELITYNQEIEVVKGKWIEIVQDRKMSFPITSLKRKLNFENPEKQEFVYFLNTEENNNGLSCFIKLDYWENQQFLWNQRKHWIQDRDFIKFIFPIVISMLSLFVAYLAYMKK